MLARNRPIDDTRREQQSKPCLPLSTHHTVLSRVLETEVPGMAVQNCIPLSVAAHRSERYLMPASFAQRIGHQSVARL